MRMVARTNEHFLFERKREIIFTPCFAQYVRTGQTDGVSFRALGERCRW